MAAKDLEDRLSVVESELAGLKRQLEADKSRDRVPWFEKIFGTFKDDPEYDEAMRLGRQYRMSQRPHYDNESDQK